jgi:hypothetical protein
MTRIKGFHGGGGFGGALPGYDLGPDTPVDDRAIRSFSFFSTLESYRNLRTQSGGPRLWVTDFGWAAGPATDQAYSFANSVTRDAQAEWTVRALEVLRGSGEIGAAFLWLLDGAPSNPNNPLSMWSMVDQDWNPYPVYSAVQQMAK